MTVAEVAKLRKTWHLAIAAQDLAQTVADNTFNVAASGTMDDAATIGTAVDDLVAMTSALAAIWSQPTINPQATQAAPHKR